MSIFLIQVTSIGSLVTLLKRIHQQVVTQAGKKQKKWSVLFRNGKIQEFNSQIKLQRQKPFLNKFYRSSKHETLCTISTWRIQKSNDG